MSTLGNDYKLLIMMALLTLFSSVLLIWNHAHAMYFDVNFLGRIDSHYSMLVYGLLVVAGIATARILPRISLILKSIGYVSLSCAAILFATSAVFTTPFPLQDAVFFHFDALLGFKQGAFMGFVHSHHVLDDYLQFCYFLLVQVALLVPIVLALLNDARAMYRFLLVLMVATFIGFAVYYFWPTTAPVSQMHSPYFTSLQHQDVLQFIALHSHHKLMHYGSGIIGFPSFHVIWALLVVYGFWKYKILRSIALVFALSVMVSTLSTGWHYVADVLAAVGVVFLSVFIVERFVLGQKRGVLQGELCLASD